MKRTAPVRVVLVALGLVIFTYSLAMCFLVNFNMGAVFCGGLALVLLFCGIFWRWLWRCKWILALVGTGFGLLVVMVCFLAIYGQWDNADYDEEAVIVLGAGIRGEEVSLTLAMRLDAAAAYHEKNPGALIVVSGGQGPQEDIPEALAMERYLLAKGIPPESIIREKDSHSTYENLVNSKAILDERLGDAYRVVVITNGFHVYRADFLAKAAGLDGAHIHAALPWYTGPVNYVRECAAVLKAWIWRV